MRHVFGFDFGRAPPLAHRPELTLEALDRGPNSVVSILLEPDCTVLDRALDGCRQALPTQIVFDQEELGGRPDALCALAPRPLMVQLGTNDPGMTANVAAAPLGKVADTYELLGARDQYDLHVFEGEHEIDAPAAVRWLAEHL